MSRYQTIYEKLMSEQADNNFAFLDMEFLLSHISFQLKRIKGDHAIYASENFAEIINLQKVNGKVKPYQVLPGCMSDGATVDGALKNTDTIIQEWIELATDLGRPIPPQDSYTLEFTGARITDVAAYILSCMGKTTAWQLEKLAYYIHAWCLGLYFHPMTAARFEDWKDGPVCRELYETHRGKFYTEKTDYILRHDFSCSEERFMDSILNVYGDKSPEWLKRQTHMEDPWKKTRGSIPLGTNDEKVISDKIIMAYYHN